MAGVTLISVSQAFYPYLFRYGRGQAKDVHMILYGAVNSLNAHKLVRADEVRSISKGDDTNSFPSLYIGRASRLAFDSESGLYKLIMRSDKPEARKFQDWVTREVLPAIRKDGLYVAGEEKVRTGGISEGGRPDEIGPPWRDFGGGRLTRSRRRQRRILPRPRVQNGWGRQGYAKSGQTPRRIGASLGERTPSIVRVGTGRVFATSLDVADYFGKQHFNVLQDIDRVLAEAPEASLNFQVCTYRAERGGRSYRKFEMDRDGFTLLAMGFTGPKAAGSAIGMALPFR